MCTRSATTTILTFPALLSRYFETEITQDAHVLNADIERLEKEKIRLTILIRKLDARLKSLVTQVKKEEAASRALRHCVHGLNPVVPGCFTHCAAG